MLRSSRFLLAAIAVASLCLSAAASAQRFYDPPGRVARISDMRGDVVYSPAGDGEWYSAHRNRPLVRGDALWSDRGARAELQAGSTWLRMDGETSVEFLELSDRMLQLEVTEGSLNVRIRRLYPGQRVEVDTPNLALVFDRPGTYRVDVDREGDHTAVEVREGGGLAYGVGGRFPVRRGDLVVFYGEDIRDYEIYSFPAPDSFDRYVRMRDQRIDRSPTLRYLGDDLIGFSDLDDYGRWGTASGYGNVWYPSNVYAGWAPYQDGQWVWQEPWGWTWVDEQPWGFAPSHYGRWAWVDGRWGWIPGPRNTRSVYAPALVGFIEDLGGSIGWFPLGPGDIYYPSYSVSSNYFNSVNVANTSVAVANVGRAYTSFGRANSVPLTQGQGYRNRTVATAVTTVPKDVFTNSRPVRQAQQRGREKELLGRGEMRRNLGVRPGAAAVQGAGPRARVRPPREVEDEQVFVRNAPPAQAAAPSTTGTSAPAPAVRERPRRVRTISEQSATADARASGPRREPGEAAAAPSAKPQALDREALPSERGARRDARRQQREATPAGAPVPVTTPTPTPAATPAPAPAATPIERANQDEARQAAEARAAAEKAREERRQAMEAQRKSEQQQREAAGAERQAQQQREQAQAAERDTQQQNEAAAAQAKAQQEREQARTAEREAQRQQRESERAQREAAQQQAEAKQAAQTADTAQAATAAAVPAPPARGQARECVPAERIEAMRKRGVPEERIAELKVCPAEPAQ